MKSLRLSAAAAALAACLAAAGTAPAFALDVVAAPDATPGAAAAAPRGPEGFRPAGGAHGFGPNGFGGHGPGAPGPDMPFAPFAHLPLHGLQLTDVQQDRIFAILHAQAPREVSEA